MMSLEDRAELGSIAAAAVVAARLITMAVGVELLMRRGPTRGIMADAAALTGSAAVCPGGFTLCAVMLATIHEMPRPEGGKRK